MSCTFFVKNADISVASRDELSLTFDLPEIMSIDCQRRRGLVVELILCRLSRMRAFFCQPFDVAFSTLCSLCCKRSAVLSVFNAAVHAVTLQVTITILAIVYIM